MTTLGNFDLVFNTNYENLTEFLKSSNGPEANKQLTLPILGKYELAKLLYNYANLLDNTIESEFLGEKLEDSDAIVNACDLIMKRKIPYILKRDILFDKTVYETFDISKMYINMKDVMDIKRYIKDNSIPLIDSDPEKILALINS